MTNIEIMTLRKNDIVEFVRPFYSFTKGKKYKVKVAEGVRYIDDDSGIGSPLSDTHLLKHNFKLSNQLIDADQKNSR